MTLSVMESIEKAFQGVRDFVVEKGENPLFWILAFFLGVGLFWLTYSALNKNNN